MREVARAHVVCTVGLDGRESFTAYVSPAGDRRPPSPVKVRSVVAQTMGGPGVPRDVVLLRELPCDDQGVVDESRLDSVAIAPYEEPATAVERMLAPWWAEALVLDRVGRADDFFGLGGGSRAAAPVLARVSAELGVRVRDSDLVRASTLAGFAGLVEARRRGEHHDGAVVTVNADADGPGVFCLPGAGASSTHFAHLAARLPGSPVHIVQARGYERPGVQELGLGGIVRRRVAAIRRLQPRGPYVVVGHSLGAVFALETARRLQDEGEEVAVAILDPFWSASGLGVDLGVAPTVGEILTPELIGRPGGLPPRHVLLLRRARRLSALPLANVLPMPAERRERLLFTLGWVVGRTYRSAPWDGKVLAYRSADNTDPDEMWRDLFPAPLVDRRYPCEHNSVLRPPYVDQVAADLRDATATFSVRQPPSSGPAVPRRAVRSPATRWRRARAR
ncbi:alpha/beta fold hydrolase [Isoptericola sp. NPDC019482]|uniref:alpha/beta fold hydrolase n=1 Tax=Isoptericola sp. NPDC019482 TaxID=3154688 RepID=UPI003487E0C7